MASESILYPTVFLRSKLHRSERALNHNNTNKATTSNGGTHFNRHFMLDKGADRGKTWHFAVVAVADVVVAAVAVAEWKFYLRWKELLSRQIFIIILSGPKCIKNAKTNKQCQNVQKCNSFNLIEIQMGDLLKQK